MLAEEFNMLVMTKCDIASVEYSGTFVTRMPRFFAFSISMLLKPVPASHINFTEVGSKSISISISFVTMQLWPSERSATTSGEGEESWCAVNVFMFLFLMLVLSSPPPPEDDNPSAWESECRFNFPSKSNRPAFTTQTFAIILLPLTIAFLAAENEDII